MCFLQCAHFCSYRAVRDTGAGRHDHLHEEVLRNTAVGQPSCGLSLSDVCVCAWDHACVCAVRKIVQGLPTAWRHVLRSQGEAS